MPISHELTRNIVTYMATSPKEYSDKRMAGLLQLLQAEFKPEHKRIYITAVNFDVLVNTFYERGWLWCFFGKHEFILVHLNDHLIEGYHCLPRVYLIDDYVHNNGTSIGFHRQMLTAVSPDYALKGYGVLNKLYRLLCEPRLIYWNELFYCNETDFAKVWNGSCSFSI